MNKWIVIVMIGAIPSISHAQTLIEKNGTCPSGFSQDGHYCISKSNKLAVPLVSTCPSRYNQDGHYCISSGTKQAYIRSGTCPSGFSQDGHYCVAK